MTDTEPQTASGKVLWHFTMSLDGFVAGPDHAKRPWARGFCISFQLVRRRSPGDAGEPSDTTQASRLTRRRAGIYQPPSASQPPSTATLVPVMYEASSLAKKATVAAISAGSP